MGVGGTVKGGGEKGGMRRIHRCRICNHPQVTKKKPGEIMFCSKCNNPNVVNVDDGVFE